MNALRILAVVACCVALALPTAEGGGAIASAPDCECGSEFCWKQPPCSDEPCPAHCIEKYQQVKGFGRRQELGWHYKVRGIPIHPEFYKSSIENRAFVFGGSGRPLTPEEERQADINMGVSIDITILSEYADWINEKASGLWTESATTPSPTEPRSESRAFINA